MSQQTDKPEELKVESLERPKSEIPIGIFRQRLVINLLLLIGGTLAATLIADTAIIEFGHDPSPINNLADKVVPLEFSAMTGALGYFFGRSKKDE